MAEEHSLLIEIQVIIFKNHDASSHINFLKKKEKTTNGNWQRITCLATLPSVYPYTSGLGTCTEKLNQLFKE